MASRYEWLFYSGYKIVEVGLLLFAIYALFFS